MVEGNITLYSSETANVVGANRLNVLELGSPEFDCIFLNRWAIEFLMDLPIKTDLNSIQNFCGDLSLGGLREFFFWCWFPVNENMISDQQLNTTPHSPNRDWGTTVSWLISRPIILIMASIAYFVQIIR